MLYFYQYGDPMKKLVFVLSTILAFTLTACGALDSAAPATVSETGSAAGSLSSTTMILVGTLKLDGTDQAVTSTQAKELLPLWQVYQSLSTSDTAAKAEIAALEKQIQETMTGQQMQAIQAMNLTPQDTFAIIQQMGLGGGRGQTANNGNNRQGNGADFFPPGGGAPPSGGGGRDQGGFTVQGGGGGPSFSGGQGFSPEQMATAQAARSQRSGGNFLPSALLDALIQYLQKLSGGMPRP
jgi:hypothetical protein